MSNAYDEIVKIITSDGIGKNVLRRFAVWCTLSYMGKYLTSDDIAALPESVNACKVAEQYCSGSASAEDLSYAWHRAFDEQHDIKFTDFPSLYPKKYADSRRRQKFVEIVLGLVRKNSQEAAISVLNRTFLDNIEERNKLRQLQLNELCRLLNLASHTDIHTEHVVEQDNCEYCGQSPNTPPCQYCGAPQ